MTQSLLPNICDFLSLCDPFDSLPENVRQEIASGIEIAYYRQGDVVEPEQIVGSGLFIVRVGAVEQRHHDKTLRARLASGDLFGFSQLDRKGAGDYMVTALENTLLYKIPKSVLKKVMAENKAMLDHFAGKEGRRLASGKRDYHQDDDALYLKPVSGVFNAHIAKVTPDTTIQEAAQEMVLQHRSSVLVMDGANLLGIVTDRDMTKRVIAKGVNMSRPISDVMTATPCTIESHEPVIRAVELMMQNNVRSLPVVKNGKVKGVLTATSLVSKSSVQAVYLISRIYRQESVEELKSLTLQRQAVFETLVDSGVHPRSIQQMMTLVADAFNKRLLQLAERELGIPPCEYVWVVAGSQARGEVNYLSDQDNGLILACTPDDEQKRYFRQLTEFVCYGLAECGYSLCPGHMMASNPKWCQPLGIWQEYYRQWVVNPEAESLLNISVFLDIRRLYGSELLFQQLSKTIRDMVEGNRRFLAVLLANSLRVSPPLGMFRQFVLAKDGENRSVFNIKKQAVSLVVELARSYALASTSLLPATEERLVAAVAAGVISDETRKELLEAFYFISQVQYSHQRNALVEGKVGSHNIAPALLTQFERNHLKDAFRIIARTQEAARQRFSSIGVIR